MTNSYLYQNLVAQDRFGLQVAARLSDAADELPYDISERLRAARTRALSQRRSAAQTASSVTRSGSAATLTFGTEQLNWWDRVAAAAPLLALVLGLVAINVIQNDKRANEIAEIDAALLTDDLPPAAYTDPGFTQFLKSRAGQD
ncbi:MAG: DUF3619 family protein [Comamonadaceae bacterium]|jgi:hypothetical protein|nr:DUF3619 family protein [Rhodoferax sp.]TSA08222.1 MAG: DUF3619 family protein [Comamonadaceae bacterium]